MTAPSESTAWDLHVRPHLMPRWAWAAATLIAAAHIVVATLLKANSAGVPFRTSDQVAIACLGIIIGGALLLLTRPRLRVGAPGVSVRNLFGDRLIPWQQVVAVYFPAGKRWARLELPGDEYIPVMAVQAVDKARAVAAMGEIRALVARYRQDGSPRG